ncbi:unnamed protein product [Prunus armeniaca]
MRHKLGQITNIIFFTASATHKKFKSWCCQRRTAASGRSLESSARQAHRGLSSSTLHTRGRWWSPRLDFRHPRGRVTPLVSTCVRHCFHQ